MSLVNRLNKVLWKPLVRASYWATRTPARHRWFGRPLERTLGGLTTSLKAAQTQPDAGTVAREWQRMMPSPKKVPIVEETADTVVAEIHEVCPYRGTGNVRGCHRMMEYDRKMLEKIGGELVVLRSQAEPGVSVCKVALRRKGADLSDLTPAHVRVG
ncbi:MAG: hypothetical protein P4L83_21335 [Nevskia sp.]|nr:hypothetical protein [Nevskia sp.]